MFTKINKRKGENKMKTNANKKPKTTYFLTKSFTAKKRYLEMILKIMRVILGKENMVYMAIITSKEDASGDFEETDEDYIYRTEDIIEIAGIMNKQITKMISEDAENYVNIAGCSLTDPDITNNFIAKITYEDITKED